MSPRARDLLSRRGEVRRELSMRIGDRTSGPDPTWSGRYRERLAEVLAEGLIGVGELIWADRQAQAYADLRAELQRDTDWRNDRVHAAAVIAILWNEGRPLTRIELIAGTVTALSARGERTSAGRIDAIIDTLLDAGRPHPDTAPIACTSSGATEHFAPGPGASGSFYD